MKLSGNQIRQEIKYGAIEIDPFNLKLLNPNSYNLRLGNTVKTYDTSKPLDTRNMKDIETTEIEIPESGLLLNSCQFYLAHTIERTNSPQHAPLLEGRSSIGRLGLFVHVSAGFGDVGFNGQWTLELYPTMPIIVYPAMEICQVAFHEVKGSLTQYKGNYQGQAGAVSSLYEDR